MRGFWVIALCIASLSGCSFRAPSAQAGQIVSLTGAGRNAAGLYQINATSEFKGAVADTSLAVVHPIEAGVIRVVAYGTIPTPFLGLGVFPVDRTSPQRRDLTTTLVLQAKGSYELKAFTEDGRLTASASLVVE